MSMARIALFPALLLVLVTARGGLAQTGRETDTLNGADPRLSTGESYQDFTVPGQPGAGLVAVLVSLDFDGFLILTPPGGKQVENDDYGGSDVARVAAVAESAGAFSIRVTSYEAGETGVFTLLWGPRSAEKIAEETALGDEPEGPFYENLTVGVTIPAGERGPRSWSGTLATGDSTLPLGEFYEAYAIEAVGGDTLTAVLTSPDFDTYLVIRAPSGAVSENDDDGLPAGGTNSRLEVPLTEPGRWIIVASSLAGEETGAYELTLTRRGAQGPAVAPAPRP